MIRRGQWLWDEPRHSFDCSSEAKRLQIRFGIVSVDPNVQSSKTVARKRCSDTNESRTCLIDSHNSPTHQSYDTYSMTKNYFHATVTFLVNFLDTYRQQVPILDDPAKRTIAVITSLQTSDGSLLDTKHDDQPTLQMPAHTRGRHSCVAPRSNVFL